MDKIFSGRRVRVPIRATLSYLLASGAAKLVGIVSTALFTRIMSGEEYGAYTVYMSWLGIAVTVSSAVASAGVVYTGLGEYRSEREDYLSSLTALYFLFSITVSVGVAVAMTVYGAPRVMILPLSLQCAADGAVSIYLAEKKHFYSYGSVVFITLLEAVASPIVSWFLITACGAGYLGRVVGYLAVPLIFAAVITARRMRRGRAFVFSIWKRILTLTLPLLPYSLAGAISSQADKLILGARLGEGGIAAYSVVHTVASARGLFALAIGSALYPWISRRIVGERRGEIRGVLSSVSALYGTLAVYTVAFTPEMLSILAPPEYAAATAAVIPIAASGIPLFLSGVAVLTLNGKGYGKSITAASAASAAAGIVGGLLLISPLGYVGAGTSYLISALVLLLLLLPSLGREGLLGLFPISRTAVYFAASVAYSTLIFALYPYPVLRILALIPPSLLTVRECEPLLDMLFEA